jgi:alkylation response protein AidB-like acyl-CoA dehydrogenase
MLQRFDERAPVYDRENRFFEEDFEELRQSGYLNAALPQEYGGAGLNLAEVMKLQQRLAYYAPATAIAVNMHLYWVGLAADMVRMGDDSVKWILEEASRGHIFAAAHGERGNDVPILLSTTRAEHVLGGWKFHGHKIFGSLSPVWTYLGLHGMDVSDPENPRVVHAFLARDAENFRIVETWDTLGMRATQSHDTILEGAFVPDDRIALVCPPGEAGAGLFQVCIDAWALLGFAAVYAGIAQRAFDMTVESVKTKTSIALTRPMAYHPEVQHEVARMRLALESLNAHLASVCNDWVQGFEDGEAMLVKVIAAKYMVVTQAWQVVDTALDLSGGAGIFKRNRMEQLFRDARLGRVHPANSALTHEFLGKASLGISGDESPRWG